MRLLAIQCNWVMSYFVVFFHGLVETGINAIHFLELRPKDIVRVIFVSCRDSCGVSMSVITCGSKASPAAYRFYRT